MILLYYVPFSATLGYLFDENYLWGMTSAATELELDPLIISNLLLMGLIGLAGLLAGMSFAPWSGGARSAMLPPAPRQKAAGSLSLLAYLFAVLLALFFSWLSAPAETILARAYASSGTESMAARMNFNSLMLFSYLLMVLLWIDAEVDRYASRRRHKIWLLLAATAYITIFLQLARGDRDVTGLLAGLLLLYLTSPVRQWSPALWRAVYWSRVRKVALPALLVLALLITLGSARFVLSDSTQSLNPKEMFLSGLKDNTWTYLLLNNLGTAAEYSDGSIEYLYGQTYFDYVLSLPPGALTKLLGIERPLEAHRGPNYWYEDLSLGGIHPVCVPFKNFGAAGLAGILAVYGFLIGRCEIANASGRFLPRFLFGSLATTSFLWFWYGDMNVIRCLCISGVFALIYRAACAAAPLRTRSDNPQRKRGNAAAMP
jgi:hypothetical protein